MSRVVLVEWSVDQGFGKIVATVFWWASLLGCQGSVVVVHCLYLRWLLKYNSTHKPCSGSCPNREESRWWKGHHGVGGYTLGTGTLCHVPHQPKGDTGDTEAAQGDATEKPEKAGGISGEGAQCASARGAGASSHPKAAAAREADSGDRDDPRQLQSVPGRGTGRASWYQTAMAQQE